MSTRVLAAAAAFCLGSFGAMAADLPMRSAPPAFAPPAPIFSWTACSVGTLTGYSLSDRNTVTTTGPGVAAGVRPGTARVPYDGLTSIGGGVGCDWQFAPGNGFVAGVAADGTWMNLTRGRTFVGTTGAISDFRQSIDTLATFRGRIGYGFDRFLVYGTGGFAFGNVEYRSTFFSGGRGSVITQFGTFDDLETGYVYGGGIEYAIPTDSFLNSFNVLQYVGITSSAATVKVEYLRYDLGSRTITVNPQVAGAPTNTSRFSTEGNLIRGGFTYRFGL